jgi:hypothetical protein
MSRRIRVYLDDRLVAPRDWLGVVIPLAIVSAFAVLAVFHYCGVLP